jgi:hypothetical protein
MKNFTAFMLCGLRMGHLRPSHGLDNGLGHIEGQGLALMVNITTR